jgi:outer membrane protein assembly factor BamB
MVRNLFAGICIVVLLSTVCAAGPGGVKWTSRYQSGANGQALGVACSGSKVYAVGNYWDLNKTDADGRPVLILYDATKGTSSAIGLFEGRAGGLISAVKTSGNKVFTSGQYATDDQRHAFVNAYTAKGEVWERIWLDSASRAANDIVLAQNEIIAAGANTAGMFNVTALKVSDGTVLWENDSTTAGLAYAVTASSGRVFAVGRYDDPDNYRSRFVVRAFDAATGSLLWEDAQGTAGQPTGFNYSAAYAVAANGSRVYVVGTLHSPHDLTSGASFVVHAYDARTGWLAWRDNYDLYRYFDDAAYAVQLDGSRLFVGGYVTRSGGGTAFTVRAYNAAKGNVLWTALDGGYNLEQTYVQALTVSGNRVYAAGVSTNDLTGFAVKAYDANKGTVVWSDHVSAETAGTYTLAPAANAICAAGSSVFSGGTSSVADGGQAFTVRANSIR